MPLKCSFLAKFNSTEINKSPSSTETCTVMTRRLLNWRENNQNAANRHLDLSSDSVISNQHPAADVVIAADVHQTPICCSQKSAQLFITRVIIDCEFQIGKCGSANAVLFRWIWLLFLCPADWLRRRWHTQTWHQLAWRSHEKSVTLDLWDSAEENENVIYFYLFQRSLHRYCKGKMHKWLYFPF